MQLSIEHARRKTNARAANAARTLFSSSLPLTLDCHIWIQIQDGGSSANREIVHSSRHFLNGATEMHALFKMINVARIQEGVPSLREIN